MYPSKASIHHAPILVATMFQNHITHTLSLCWSGYVLPVNRGLLDLLGGVGVGPSSD